MPDSRYPCWTAHGSGRASCASATCLSNRFQRLISRWLRPIEVMEYRMWTAAMRNISRWALWISLLSHIGSCPSGHECSMALASSLRLAVLSSLLSPEEPMQILSNCSCGSIQCVVAASKLTMCLTCSEARGLASYKLKTDWNLRTACSFADKPLRRPRRTPNTFNFAPQRYDVLIRRCAN